MFSELGRQAADSFIKEANIGNVLKTVGKGIVKAPEFLKNTFYPGAELLKSRLANTGRVYSNTAIDPSALRNAQSASGVRLNSANRAMASKSVANSTTKGSYYPKANVAVARAPIGSAAGKSTMRHELSHGVQYNTPSYENSFNGLLTRMADSSNPWLRAASDYGRELGAHSAQGKGLFDQLRRGASFIGSQGKAKTYSRLYKNRFGTSDLFGDRYGFVHNTINKAAPYAAGSAVAVPTLAATGLTYGALSGGNNGNQL